MQQLDELEQLKLKNEIEQLKIKSALLFADGIIEILNGLLERKPCSLLQSLKELCKNETPTDNENILAERAIRRELIESLELEESQNKERN